MDAAIRDGRRIRRTRRIRAFSAGLLAIAAAVTAFVLVGDGGVAGRRDVPIEAAGRSTPQTVPPVPPAPMASIEARTFSIRSGSDRAGQMREKATSAAMLHLLTQLLPPGRTSHFAVAPEDDLQVQLYLDGGSGPGVVRVEVDKSAPEKGAEPPRGATARVTIRHMPDNCLESMVVDAAWPDGTVVQVEVPSCLDGPQLPPAPPALTVDEAVRVAADPRWGVTMDTALITVGASEFPSPPVID
ncbi:hypothetical protein ACIA5D_18625 [Actinoplanes sp. NPDC051513]|uniref:hypothetical protein n=1 Tax=Actinoplanes sp. NPDC051513 TaxID=3363908 RepID=UPI0037AC2A01